MCKPRHKSPEILVLGDINVDIIGRVKSWPEPGQECLAERLELHCGGVGANCALALRRWGVSVQLIGCVGKDDFGGFLLKTLAADGVNVRCVRRTGKAMTGMLYINVTADGQRTFFGSRGANQLVGRLGQSESSLLERARAASLMGYSFLDEGGEAAAQQIIAAVHRRNGWVSLDAGMEPSKKIPGKILRVAKTVDLLFVSNEEATTLTGYCEPEKAFNSLLDLAIPKLVMKLGKRGCLIVDEGTVRQVPSLAVRAVDSTGAGDAFTAAFLQGQLRGWHITEAALAANAAGAAAAAVVGAGERLPNAAANRAGVARAAAEEAVGLSSLAGAAAPQWEMTQASEDHGETEAIGGSRSVVRENSDEFRRKDTKGILDFLVGTGTRT